MTRSIPFGLFMNTPRAAAVVTPEVGALIAGRYRVEGTLGQGGMGVVLSVREESTREPLAIKLLGVVDGPDGPEATEDTAERAARLTREAQAAMRIASEHVVRVRDVSSPSSSPSTLQTGEAALGPYIVMERLEGIDLADAWPLGEKMPVTEAADVGMQVCEALSHAHAAGIVHRDIKPSNLFLARGPSGDSIIKVLDFGISKLTSRAEWERTQGTLTYGDAVLGSPQFVSPEQLRDSSAVDSRTDIWSLGVVIHRLLCGAYPFTGDTIGQLFTRILERDPKRLSDHHGVASKEAEAMQRILDRCMEKDVDARYTNVGELARDLAPLASERWAALADAIQARCKRRPASQSMPAPPGSKRNASSRAAEMSPNATTWRRGRAPTIAAAAALIAGVVVIALTFTRRNDAGNIQPTVSASSPSSSSPSAPSSASAGLNDRGVEVTISADAPIEKVRVAGLRRVTIEKESATLLLAEWTGAIDIDAELAGGKSARASITMDGPRTVHLVTIAAATATAVVPATSTSAAGVPTPTPTRGLPAVVRSAKANDPAHSASTPAPNVVDAGSVAPPAGTELHANPYARPSASPR